MAANKHDVILLQWRTDGVEYEKELNRDDFYAIFDGLAKGFRDENEISKIFLKYIPIASSVFINNDANSTRDRPFVVFLRNNLDYGSNILKVVEVIRFHKIIWAVLNKLMEADSDPKVELENIKTGEIPTK